MNNSIKDYIESKTVYKPFFVFTSDDEYKGIYNELSLNEFKPVSISSYCQGNDMLPDIDSFLSFLKINEESNVASESQYFVVIGLGEYLAIRGKQEAKRVLSLLKTLDIGSSKKVILLLRGIGPLIEDISSDVRFDNRRFVTIGNANCDLSIVLAGTSLCGLHAEPGIKSLLKKFENGVQGKVVINTRFKLDDSLLSVQKINDAYDGVKLLINGFNCERKCGSNKQWTELLTDLNQLESISLEAIFKKYNFANNPMRNFYTRISGKDYSNWVYYIFLKSIAGSLQNSYLSYVLNLSTSFDNIVHDIINTILNISHEDERFADFYRERKELLAEFPDSVIINFINKTKILGIKQIYTLTDNTLIEKEEIIACIASQKQFVEQTEIQNIYPELGGYLRKYIFNCLDKEKASFLTDYFESYKRQKLLNSLEPDFLQKVNDQAQKRIYNQLPTREVVLDNINKNDTTLLYWVDALGVEYLGLIEMYAQKYGLSLKINITRAILPTITTVNRSFYDSWSGEKKKSEDLDKVKHGNFKEHTFSVNTSGHLATEIEIVANVIKDAASILTQQNYKKIIITSDHGASRLAVLHRKTEKYETDTTGEHSGRCCKYFENFDLPFATSDNGYIILADYGRFKGSRAANVEVHGGASLEEVIVPVIEISLKDDNINVSLTDNNVLVDYRTGAKISLFVNQSVKNLSIVLNGVRYSGNQIDRNRYSVEIPDLKRAGEYLADVYDGDNLIGNIAIRTHSKSGNVNREFEDLF